MTEPETSAILKEYDEHSILYHSFANKVCDLVSDLLLVERIIVHSVSCRLKDRISLEAKIGKDGSEYKNLSDVTDIAGIRIITYLSKDVDRVGLMIDREFFVDNENSIDKRKTLDPDRFGYISLHHVVSLDINRTNLSEYAKYIGMKLEIQTRSILQHAWAEIEHDLGYKAKKEVPYHIRRRFSRVASLLELADQEFVAISDDIDQYKLIVATNISSKPAEVGIDKTSLASYFENSDTLRQISFGIADIIGRDLVLRPWSTDLYIERFSVHGIETIEALERKLCTNRDKIINFAKAWLSSVKKENSDTSSANVFDIGIAIFYLFYVLIGESDDYQLAKESMKKIGKTGPSESLIDDVFKTYGEISKL